MKYLARLREFEAKVKSEEIKPSHFALVPAFVSEKVKVQEFFNKPSLMSLINFLQVKLGKSTKTLILSKQMALLCKQFANQHNRITLDKLVEVRKELDIYNIHAINVIVLGLIEMAKSEYQL